MLATHESRFALRASHTWSSTLTIRVLEQSSLAFLPACKVECQLGDVTLKLDCAWTGQVTAVKLRCHPAPSFNATDGFIEAQPHNH